VPSHPILPQARRAALEAAFDEALAEVRAAGDVALLQECRSIFRKRVPLNLRAYVAAALALKGAGASRPSDARGRNADSGRNDRNDRDGRNERGDKRKDGRQQKDAQPAPSSGKSPKQKKEQPPRESREAREPRAAVEPAETREPREVRENRYRGEGVTLFVSAGRRQRFYARVAIKVLLDIPGVADESVGDIRTMDNYSFIVVDPAVEEIVIAGLNGYDFKGRVLAVNRARKRGESAPAAEESTATQVRDFADGAADAGDTDVDTDLGASELEEFGRGGDDAGFGGASGDEAGYDDAAIETDDAYSDDAEGMAGSDDGDEPEGDPTENA